MKKANSKNRNTEDVDMLPEYDFSGGVRGKHYKAYRKGHTVKIHKADGTVSVQYFLPREGSVLLEPEVREYFPDSDAVNNALRCLIPLLQRKRGLKQGKRLAASKQMA
jgi:hypothetical protein